MWMPNLLLFSLAVIVLAFVGALIAALALLPLIRRLGQNSTVARTAIICLLALVSFAVGFGLSTRLNAEVDYIFANITIVDTFDSRRSAYVAQPSDYEASKPHVVRELWVRHLIPPPLRLRCYASEAWVCEKADQVLPGTVAWSWSSYLQQVGLASISIVASSMLAWWFTRKGH
jgi:hypothetical protein